MCVASVTEEGDKEEGFGVETLEMKSGEKVKVLILACMEAEIKDSLLLLLGKVGGKKVEVLRDTECSGVIIRRELVDEADFPGETRHIMTMDRAISDASSHG